jgi:hypothetical protein
MHLRVGPSALIGDDKQAIGMVLCILRQQAIQGERLPNRKTSTQPCLSLAKRRPIGFAAAGCQKNSLIKLLTSKIIYFAEYFESRVFPWRSCKPSNWLFFSTLKDDDED